MRRRIVVLGIIVVLLVGVGWGWHVWTSPALFADGGSGRRSEPQPVADAWLRYGVVGPEVDGDREVVTLHRLEPVFVTGTDRARVDFLRQHGEQLVSLDQTLTAI